MAPWTTVPDDRSHRSVRALAIGLTLLLAGCATGSESYVRGGDGGMDAATLDATTVDASMVDATTSLDARGPDRDASLPLPSDGAVDAPGCPPGRTRCGAACIDLATDVAHCGACDRACAVPFGTERCVAGSCVVGTCDPGRGDCNAMPADGCERTCAPAACTTACGTTGSLSCASVCAPTCAPPAESCNARDDDCDGACESGLSGCRAAVHRARRNAGGHFYTTDRAEAGLPAFTVETYDYFFLYAASAPGLVELHRCHLADGRYFYTTSSVCEGAAGAVHEGVLGWMGSAALCGSTPLYRLWSSVSGHFYTVDSAERSSAIASGYVDEGVAGHVWRAR